MALLLATCWLGGWDGWVSCQPLRVTRSSTAICCARTTWTRSLAWNAFFELLPYIGKKRQMDEQVHRNASRNLCGTCDRSEKRKKRWPSAFGLLWQTQIVLVFAMNFNGSPFPLAFAGVLHHHFNDYVRTLDKIGNPSMEFASSILQNQHILLNWCFSSTDIFQKCPRAPWSTTDEFTSSETQKTLEKPI